VPVVADRSSSASVVTVSRVISCSFLDLAFQSAIGSVLPRYGSESVVTAKPGTGHVSNARQGQGATISVARAAVPSCVASIVVPRQTVGAGASVRRRGRADAECSLRLGHHREILLGSAGGMRLLRVLPVKKLTIAGQGVRSSCLFTLSHRWRSGWRRVGLCDLRLRSLVGAPGQIEERHPADQGHPAEQAQPVGRIAFVRGQQQEGQHDQQDRADDPAHPAL
jgi:hypothetical protein